MEKIRKKLVREKAVIAMYQYILTQATEEEILAYLNECYKPRMNDAEVAACQEIVFKTIENLSGIEEKVKVHLKKGWTLERISMMEKAILYISVTELKDLPKEIVINEAVELTKKYCDEDAYKFVHGVLGQIG